MRHVDGCVSISLANQMEDVGGQTDVVGRSIFCVILHDEAQSKRACLDLAAQFDADGSGSAVGDGQDNLFAVGAGEEFLIF